MNETPTMLMDLNLEWWVDVMITLDRERNRGPRERSRSGAAEAVPNLHQMLTRSPVALEVFEHFESILARHGRLTRDEQAIVALEVAMRHKCNYCRGVMFGEAHDAGVEDEHIQAVMHGFEPDHARYRVLVDATRRILSAFGCLTSTEAALLEERGVVFEDLMEIVSIIGAATLAAYANNLARNRMDTH